MKAFILGFIATGIIALVSAILRDGDLFIKAVGVLGFGSWIVSGITSGAFIKNIHRITATESRSEMMSRHERAATFFTFGIPGVIAFCVYLFLQYK